MSDREHQLQMPSEAAVDVVAFAALKAPSTDSTVIYAAHLVVVHLYSVSRKL